MTSLLKNPPIYILKPPRSIGTFAQLENLLEANYTLVSNIEGTDVYALKSIANTTNENIFKKKEN